VPTISVVGKTGGVLLLVIGSILVVTAVVTAVLAAERESHLVRLEAPASSLESRLHLLEGKLGQ